MREKSIPLVCIIAMFAISTALISSVKAPVVLPNIYVDPPTSTAQPGETFTIAIKVSGVSSDVGVSGWAFSIKFEFALLYTEDAWITEGDFLNSAGPTMFVKAVVPAESAWSVACTLLTPVTASGSGTLAYIQFRAEAEGKTLLNLYDTKLRDINIFPIDHTETDGYFSNIVIGDLVGHGAWPEHHHFSISKDEDGYKLYMAKSRISERETATSGSTSPYGRWTVPQFM